ncbi:hypothetical protein [Priestia aryabhattai]|uniref:hypothetical protein n=1 Tax=Priestia aryabhattai TaxID=412384 RepID=UPI0005EC1419|nr:hypothetical protein [Priestia aryabhattai]KJL04352.1 hypothetical protein N178_12545 [Priestia aryabhattai B8W22]
MKTYELFSLIISSIGVMAAIVAAVVYYIQLKKMNESVNAANKSVNAANASVEAALKANKISTLNTVLTLEERITENHIRMSEAITKVDELTAAGNQADLDKAKLTLNLAIENYLNSMDRLCASIINGLIPEEEYSRDYKSAIYVIVKNKHFTNKFNTGSPYPNIIEIYDRWHN